MDIDDYDGAIDVQFLGSLNMYYKQNKCLVQEPHKLSPQTFLFAWFVTFYYRKGWIMIKKQF